MEIRLEQVLGRSVVAPNGARIGRIEELRAQKEGQGWAITGFVIGAAGLLERLNLGARLIVGRAPGGYVARWNQLVFEDDRPVRLACPIGELEPL